MRRSLRRLMHRSRLGYKRARRARHGVSRQGGLDHRSGKRHGSARRLAAAGAQVAALDRNEAGLAEIARGHAGIHPWPLDVTDRKAVEAAVARTEREIGPIDRVMSAAGIMPTCPVLEQDPDEIHRVIAVNYTGSVNVALATFPRPMLMVRTAGFRSQSPLGILMGQLDTMVPPSISKIFPVTQLAAGDAR